MNWRGRGGGTSGYLAPEVIKHDFCSHGTDIYSLGIVFVELLAEMSDSVWNTNAVPAIFPGGEDAWEEMALPQRQVWLQEQFGWDMVPKTRLPRDSLEWDLCMQVCC